MRHDSFSQDPSQAPSSVSRPSGDADSDQTGIDFTPSTDDVPGAGCFRLVSDYAELGPDDKHRPQARVKLLAEGGSIAG